MATYDLAYPGAAIDAILNTAYFLQEAGYIFQGSASEYSGTPSKRVWLIAPAGSTGLGLSSAVPQGSIGICLYNGTSWVGKIINVATIDSTPTQNSDNAVSSGGTYAAINQLSASVTEALENLTFTDTTPSAFQDEYINMKVSTTEGGVERILTYLTILAATTSKAGLMSAEDKAKVDSFLTGIRSMQFVDATSSSEQAIKLVEQLKWTVGGVQEVIDSITLLAATSSKAGLLSASDKAYIDALPATLTSLSNSISGALALMQSLVGYYVCDTAAGTAAKTVDATGYSLTNGGCIRIKMANANTANNVTLNINSTGAKALYYDGVQASSTNTWEAGEVLEVYYDGTQYQCASGGGGKFATGEKVKDTSITDEVIPNSSDLMTSGGLSAALEPFNDLLYEKYDVKPADGTTYQLSIAMNPNPNIFETSAGAQYKGVLIPVVKGFTYVLEYSSTQYTGVALIKNSAPAAGDAVIYATGETNHYDSPTAGGVKYVYEITEDNLFLYVRNDTGTVARTWPATFYRYNEDSKKVLMKDDVQHEVTESSSAVVDSAGIYNFVKNNASLQPSDALQMTKTPFDLSQFTWANTKVGGASDPKRVRSSIVAIPANTKSIKLTLTSTGTYGYQIFVFMSSSYSEPYYTIADWDGTSNNITMELPECVGEGAYMCIYGHRLDNTNVSTSGFSSNIASLDFYTIQEREIKSAKRKSIRILFIGNSLTQDAVAWLPYVLQTGEVDVDYSLIDLYNGGFTLAQQWSAIQNKTAFEIASVCQNVIGWTNYNASKTLDDILDEFQFDILVLQEYFNYQTDPDLTAFENIVSYITERSSCPFEVVSLIHAPLRSDATNVYNRTVAGNQAILNGTCCSSLMNPGTAIYDALSTDLDSLGTRGHLSPDGTHAQEGLPCILQALNLLGWIYKKLGIASGVVNFPMSTGIIIIYSSLHIPGANGSVVEGNFAQQKLATKVAAASIRKLQKIELGLS